MRARARKERDEKDQEERLRRRRLNNPVWENIKADIEVVAVKCLDNQSDENTIKEHGKKMHFLQVGDQEQRVRERMEEEKERTRQYR